MRVFLACLALVSAAPALGETRNYTVTFFDKIKVQGDISVTVETGGSPSARSVGDRRSIDRVKAEVRGTTLNIGLDRANWTGTTIGKAPTRAEVFVRMPAIVAAYVDGSGDLVVDRARGAGLVIQIRGSGNSRFDAVTVDRIDIAQVGAGALTIAGTVKQAKIALNGSGNLDADALRANDTDIRLYGPGAIRATATRTAKVDLRGSGSITVAGNPACTVNSQGSGEISCGRGSAGSAGQ